MPVGYRDLYLVLRAENLGSRAINQFGASVDSLGASGISAGQRMKTIGSSLLSTGTIMAATGVIGLKVMYDMNKAFVNYSNQAALTQTQTLGLKISLQQLMDTGIAVARQIPLPLSEMQGGLYDIFSSLNVNLPQAKFLLTEFSKAGVAGQTDLSTVSKATISELNAFHLPLSDINQLLDIQFQMVKEGRGHYQDFMTSIGAAIPVYAAAGINVQQMAGDIAFLSRQGAFGSRAITEAARAVEAMNKAAFQKGLKSLGIDFLDAHGKAKTLNQIVNDIATNPSWALQVQEAGSVGLAYQNTFGAGTIQARRFFDVAIPRYKDLNKVTETMYRSKGAMEAAYKIMFDQPAQKSILLHNRFQILEIGIGQQFGGIRKFIVNALSSIIGWFERLPKGTQQAIIKIALITAVVLTLGGALMVLTGIFAMFTGTIMESALWTKILFPALMGLYNIVMDALIPVFVSLADALGIGIYAAVGIATAGIALIIGAIIVVIIYHKQLWQWIKVAWHAVQNGVMDAWHWLMKLGPLGKIIAAAILIALGPIGFLIVLVVLAIKYHKDLWQWMKDAWHAVAGAFFEVWHAIDDLYHFLVDETAGAIKWLIVKWNEFMKWWHRYWPEIHQVLRLAWLVIVLLIRQAVTDIKDIIQFFMKWIVPIFRATWDVVWQIVKIAWDIIVGIVVLAWEFIGPFVKAGLDTLVAIFKYDSNTIVFVVKAAWDFIMMTVKVTVAIVRGIIEVFLDVITGHWSRAWHDLVNMVKDVGKAILTFLGQLLNNIVDWFIQLWHTGLNWMKNVGHDLIVGLWNGIQSFISNIWDFFKTLPSKILHFLLGIPGQMFDAGKNIMHGLFNGLKSVPIVGSIVGHAGNIISSFSSMLGIGSPSKVFHALGRNIYLGLINGMNEGRVAVQAAAMSLLNLAQLKTGSQAIHSLAASGVLNRGGTVVQMTVQKGAVQLNYAGAQLSAADSSNLEKQLEKAFDQFASDLERKLSQKKAA